MQPVEHVLQSTGGGNPSLTKVTDLMHTGRSFHYEYTQPYVAASPEVTEAKGAGDCKDKTLWLAKHMNTRNVRFVVGRRHPWSTLMHAWLLWRSGGEYYVLDCTTTSWPIPVSSLTPGDYVPKYSWSSTGEYRHALAGGYENQIVAPPKTHFQDQYQLASQPKPQFHGQSQVALRQTSHVDDRHRIAAQPKLAFRDYSKVTLRTSLASTDRHQYAVRRKQPFHDQYRVALRQPAHPGDRHQPTHRKPHFHDHYRVALREPAPSVGRHHSSRHKPTWRERNPLAVLPERQYLALVTQRRR
jgi:hypothetical protein